MDASRLRGSILLLPAAAFAVHQLRYWLAYGSRANAELAAQGHSYLHSFVPWTVLALALGAGSYLRSAPRRLSPKATWLASTAALLAIYVVQESLEGLLATGHPGGIGSVFGHGGWWAVPVTAVVALAVTALLAAGCVLVRLAASARVRVRLDATVVAPAGAARVLVSPLATAAAGRAPPRHLPSR